MKNKRGGDKIISVYWFAILFIVAGAIVYMAALFYGAPYDVREIESRLLTNQIADCLSQGGYLKSEVLGGGFENNFLEKCNLNFNVEDVYGWETSGEATSGGGAEFGGGEFGGAGASRSFGESGQYSQYYIEVGIYEFDEERYDGTGENVLGIIKGNPNLKTSYLLKKAEKEKGKKEMIVIHATRSASLKIAQKHLATDKASIHYIIDKNGRIVAGEVGEYEKAFHTADRDTNEKSIGIELVNLLELCGNTTGNCKWDGGTCKSICADKGLGVDINGTIWEKFPKIQIDALRSLVSEIAARHDIPIDREHIKGHYEVDPYKKRQDDPGPQFPWDEFMKELEPATLWGADEEKSFYVLGKDNNQYIIKILALVGKAEKNE